MGHMKLVKTYNIDDFACVKYVLLDQTRGGANFQCADFEGGLNFDARESRGGQI